MQHSGLETPICTIAVVWISDLEWLHKSTKCLLRLACFQPDELRQYATGWTIGIVSGDDAIYAHILCDRIQQS
jgi:hypothetical protein